MGRVMRKPMGEITEDSKVKIPAAETKSSPSPAVHWIPKPLHKLDTIHVYKVEGGELIEEAPIISHRGEDDRFGWGMWYLPPGVYIVADITRLNDVNVEAHPTLITLARLTALANRILKSHLFSLYRVEIDKVIVHEEPIDKVWGWMHELEPLLVGEVVDLSDVKRLIEKAKERCPECAPTPSSRR